MPGVDAAGLPQRDRHVFGASASCPWLWQRFVGRTDRVLGHRSIEGRLTVDYIFEAPCLTATRAIDATGRSRQAVYDAIEALEAAEVVTEISDSERYRVYEAPEILDVVASP